MKVSQQFAVLCAFISLSSSMGLRTASVEDSKGLPSFASFVTAYNRKYSEGSKEFNMRRDIFQQRLEQMQKHNSKTHRRWSAVVNHLSDRTEDELLQLRGLRIVRAGKSGRQSGVVGLNVRGGQFLGQVKSSVIPDSKSWENLEAVKADVDQSACGSCWALAASTMLRANAEIQGYHNRTFSAQELVNCVPNPHSCGGEGGCKGATVELAMNWVMEKQLDQDSETPYLGVDDTCRKTSSGVSFGEIFGNGDHSGSSLEDMIAIGFHPAKGQFSQGSQLGLSGWERLPENDLEALMRAVAERGPVAVSVSAGGWNAYGTGVFDGCERDATIDHAVTLIGYGTEGGTPYWKIKNSWGNMWGEPSGTIRLLRHQGSKEYCGTDYQPKVGTGCDGGPSTVPVCGMCGIQYDSVVAHFSPSGKNQ